MSSSKSSNITLRVRYNKADSATLSVWFIEYDKDKNELSYHRLMEETIIANSSTYDEYDK